LQSGLAGVGIGDIDSDTGLAVGREDFVVCGAGGFQFNPRASGHEASLVCYSTKEEVQPARERTRVDRGGRRKSGPKSRIEQELEAVRRLPRAKQKFASEFLETVLQGS